ncbi:MAG: prepilin-type N-terminal cleavage/methylation domain-containing protein [Acidobacteria bacterium]|nr:prepilin-type N-terminal cleavage/methylation domain-containing protein [Acidobacteriota bacterium]
MGKIKRLIKGKFKDQKGLTYIEVMIAIVILTVGILAQLSALTFSMIRVRENEQRNSARQIASSAIESIFAARDMGSANGLNNWDAVNLSSTSPNGIFVPGWHPIRRDPGRDGIHGTSDDACFYNSVCVVAGYTNSSELDLDFEREILITDIPETGFSTVRKKRIDVKVRYFVGKLLREEKISTVIADLPFYN